MKRTVKYALAAIFAAVLVSPAFATSTDNFPDVPDNHWAFEALNRLKKDGILVGYPDGLFRGNRPASRYELAVAIHACYVNLKSVTDGLDSQIKALSDKLNGLATTDDVRNLRDALNALQAEVDSMKSYGEDIANLKKLTETFQKELTALGVDVEALKKDLGDLADRVTRLEKKKPAVSIGGDIELIMFGGNSRDGNYGINQDAYVSGAYQNPRTGISSPVGLTQDLQTMEEGAFTFSGTNTDGPKWHATVVIGDMLDTLGRPNAQGFASGQSPIELTPGNGAPYKQGQNDIYIQDLSVKFDSSLVGINFNAEVGRVAYKISPYIFQRTPESSYFWVDRWDDGMYRFDGGILGFNLGSAKLNVFAGNSDSVTSSNGTYINVIQTGTNPFGDAALIFDRELGINLMSPLTSNGNINLAYLWLDDEAGQNWPSSDPSGSTEVNRLAVYGGDVNFTFGRVMFSGGYSKSDVYYNDSSVWPTNDDTAWYAKATIKGHRWGLSGGYREVDADYLAPGDWGRLGISRNPTNIEGWQVDGHLDITSKLTLKATGEFDKGQSDAYFGSPYNTGTTINTYTVGLAYNFNPNLSFNVGYEDDEFQNLNPNWTGFPTPGSPTPLTNYNASYKWTTFGINYGFSDAAKLMVQYQLSDVSNEFQAFGSPYGPRYTGGFLSTQLSIKF